MLPSEVRGAINYLLTLADAPVPEGYLELPPASKGDETTLDDASLRMTLSRHPMLLLIAARV